MKKYTIMLTTIMILTAGSALAQTALQPGQAVPRNDPNGVYCREYTQQVVIGGERRSSYGTACQQPDGDWKIVTTDQPEIQQQTQVEYVSPPEYISQPRYVMPPVAYYEPYPYYAPMPYSTIGFGAYYSNRSYYNRGRGYNGYNGYGHGRGYDGHYRH